MFKKKDKDEERRKKEKKLQMKEAKRQAKEKARLAKEEAKRNRLKIKNKAIAKKEGWYEEREAEYNTKKYLEPATDIWSAAKTGNLPQIQEYIKQGLGIGARDSDGRTALHYAAEFGHINCLQWMLALHKIDVDVQDRWGMTPLHKACFNRQQPAAEWLVLRGADLHILTEGGISPLEKAFEYGEEFAAALLTKSVQVEEEGIITEDKIDVYSDVEVKWGDKTIFVDKSTDTSSPNTVVDIPEPQEEEQNDIKPVVPLSINQQRGLEQAAVIAQSNPMQEALLRNQLEKLGDNASDSCLDPSLRDIEKLAPKPNPDEINVRVASSYDILVSSKRAIERSKQYKDVPREFSSKFDQFTTATAQFVYVLVSNTEDKSTKLTISLKAIVMSLQELFLLIHPFAGTKFEQLERGKIIKAATELQIAVQNIVQGVKNRNNALPQFTTRAEEKLNYFTQILVASVWNLHAASEYISNDILEAETREFGSVFKEIIACSLGKSSQSYSEVSCYSKMRSIQSILSVNSKIIEIYHSTMQEKLADIIFTMFKGTKGILMAAEKVKKDNQSPHKDTMTKLAKLILFNINKLCETLKEQELYEMYNFLDEQQEYEVITQATKELELNIQKYSQKDRDLHTNENEILEEIKLIIKYIRTLYKHIQPDSFSGFEIITSVRRIAACIDRITACSLSFLGEAASELLENYLVTSLRACIYFSNQLKTVAAAIAVSYPITTKMMIPLTLRFLSVSILGAMEAVETCVTIFDNPLDFDMDGILDSLPTNPDDFIEPLKQDEPLGNMATIRSTKRTIQSNKPITNHLNRPTPSPKSNANMATIRQPRKSAANIGSLLPKGDSTSNIQTSTLNELDNLLGESDLNQNTLNNNKSTTPLNTNPDVLNELDMLVNIDNNKTQTQSMSNKPDALDELSMLVNIDNTSSNNQQPIQNMASSSPISNESDALDELSMLVNIDNNPTSHNNINQVQHISNKPDALDELSMLVNIDNTSSNNQPIQNMVSSSQPTSISNESDALDELSMLVNLDNNNSTPIPQNTNQINKVDELDMLVNLDSNTQIHSNQFQQASPIQSNDNGVFDELDMLVNLDNNTSQIQSTPITSNKLDPLDELSMLVNIDNTSSNNQIPPQNIHNITPSSQSTSISNESDALDELSMLVNLDNTSQNSEELILEPMDNLELTNNEIENKNNTVTPITPNQQFKNSQIKRTLTPVQITVDPFDEINQLVNFDQKEEEEEDEFDPLSELEGLVNL